MSLALCKANEDSEEPLLPILSPARQPVGGGEMQQCFFGALHLTLAAFGVEVVVSHVKNVVLLESQAIVTTVRMHVLSNACWWRFLLHLSVAPKTFGKTEKKKKNNFPKPGL